MLARAVLKKYRPEIIAVTGSFGKTSTTKAIYTVLASTYTVGTNIKNYNNEIGIPLSIIGTASGGRSVFKWLAVFLKAFSLLLLTDKIYPEFLVLEFGADKPGDIKYLSNLVPIKVAVVTAVGPAHIEFFESLDHIAAEKGDLVRALPDNGTAVLNADDLRVLAMAGNTKAQVVTFGTVANTNYSASNTTVRQEHDKIVGLSFTVTSEDGDQMVSLPHVVGKHFVYAALAAIAVGKIYDLDVVTIVKALEEFKTPNGRMKIIAGIKHTTIIDDTYNSLPDAAIEALAFLAEVNFGRQKYAVLGDMLELGKESEALHHKVGTFVASHQVDYLITAGPLAKDIAEAARDAGLDKDHIFSFNNSVEAGEFLQSRLEPGDVVLIKGSQNMRMEKVVKEVMAEPEKAPALLVRQDSAWLKK